MANVIYKTLFEVFLFTNHVTNVLAEVVPHIVL